MRLTGHTQHALELMTHLALHPERTTTIEEIASACDIPKNHLTKVAHRLAQAGLILTTRGRAGGIRLGRAPAQINLGALVRLAEPHFTTVECFDDAQNQCILTSFCALKNLLHRATDAYLAHLDRLTLADLLPQPAHRAAARSAGTRR